MAARRVENGKRIETKEVLNADGRMMKIDFYLVKSGKYGSGITSFRAICDDADIDVEGKDFDALFKEATKLAADRSDAKWEPYLHVTVSGVRHPLKEAPEKGKLRACEDPEHRTSANLFGKKDTWNIWNRRPTQTRFGLTIEVDSYELATIAGKKLHRTPIEKGERSSNVRDGWPRVGREAHHGDHYDDVQKNMNALIPDTQANRDAIVKIRNGLADLTERIDALLSPDAIALTLLRVLSGGNSALALPPPPMPAEPARGKMKKDSAQELIRTAIAKEYAEFVAEDDRTTVFGFSAGLAAQIDSARVLTDFYFELEDDGRWIVESKGITVYGTTKSEAVAKVVHLIAEVEREGKDPTALAERPDADEDGHCVVCGLEKHDEHDTDDVCPPGFRNDPRYRPRSLEAALAEPVAKGRVRVKKAWIGTRPPSEGGNGPRG